jgi:hypothetical protein
VEKLIAPVYAGQEPGVRNRNPALVLGLIAIVVFSCVYLARSVEKANRNALWTDEVFAMWTIRGIPTNQLVNALSSGVDCQPPGYYFLQKAITHVLGVSRFVIRLPSILAFYVFLLSIFLLVRKHVGIPIAVFAMALPCLTGAAVSSWWARPYAIVEGCFGVAALLWCSADSERLPKRNGIWIALPLVAAISVHFYAVLLCVALGLMEFLWWLEHRKIRWPNWVGFTVGGASVLLWWPMILPIYRFIHASTGAPAFHAKPTLGALRDKFSELMVPGAMSAFAVGFLCLAATLLVLSPLIRRTPMWWGPDAKSDREPRASNLNRVAFAAIMLPIITFLFSVLVTKSFNTRYFFAAVMGLSLLVTQALRRIPSANLVSLCLVGAIVLGLAPRYSSGRTSSEDPVLALLRRTPQPLPILVTEASDFFVLVESAPPDVRNRLVYVAMPKGLQNPDPEPQVYANLWKRFRPDLAVFSAEDFFSRIPSFYVLCTESRREAMTDWLKAHGGLSLSDRDPPPNWLFEADSTGFATRSAAVH